MMDASSILVRPIRSAICFVAMILVMRAKLVPSLPAASLVRSLGGQQRFS